MMLICEKSVDPVSGKSEGRIAISAPSRIAAADVSKSSVDSVYVLSPIRLLSKNTRLYPPLRSSQVIQQQGAYSRYFHDRSTCYCNKSGASPDHSPILGSSAYKMLILSSRPSQLKLSVKSKVLYRCLQVFEALRRTLDHGW